MPLDRLGPILRGEIEEVKAKGALKGNETVIVGVKKGDKNKGTRYFVEGYGNREFVRMNSNSYLGITLHKEVIESEEAAAKEFGTGPGAVRFISGTYKAHTELERRLAIFHNREAAMLFSSAYATVMGVLTSLLTKDTCVISDELNHNSIINAIRLARTKDKKVYKHVDMVDLESKLKESVGQCQRVVVVTDGIFSMRGAHAPLRHIADLIAQYSAQFPEGIISVVDDSHGVGAIAETGRGTTELIHEGRVDILIGTLGKAFGVNGGYLVSDAIITDYLRETAPFYIYSNPITVSEASAALKVLEIIDTDIGRALLKHLKEMSTYFRNGLFELGYEIIRGEHPIVPCMIRDTKKTIELTEYLKDHGVLTTGIYYPVVPRGDEEIRFQVCADHAKKDLDDVLGLLKNIRNGSV